jgi:hypothetical protein
MASRVLVSPLFCWENWVRVAPAVFSGCFRLLFGCFGRVGGGIDGGRVHRYGARERPAGDGHCLDEAVIGGCGGEVFLEVGAEEGVQAGLGFALEDYFGAQAVIGGVAGGMALAFGGFGAGGFGGVCLVGCDFA